MSEIAVDRQLLEGYDVIRTTIREFRKSVQKYHNHPDNESYFWDMFRHIQFMKTDPVFDYLPSDIDELIEKVLEDSGLSLADVLNHAYQYD